MTKSGHILEEQWAFGRRNGYSRTIWDDGDMSEGYWKDGKEFGENPYEGYAEQADLYASGSSSWWW